MTYGNECLNCGMYEWACVCVPWCARHDRAQPCADCVTDPAPESDARVAYGILFAIALLCAAGYLYLRVHG